MKLFSIILVTTLLGCASIAKNNAHYENQNTRAVASADEEPLEPAILEGTIIAQGGESDAYYFMHPTMGKVHLDYRSPLVFRQIRESVGKRVKMRGGWNEREETKLIFIVYKFL